MCRGGDRSVDKQPWSTLAAATMGSTMLARQQQSGLNAPLSCQLQVEVLLPCLMQPQLSAFAMGQKWWMQVRRREQVRQRTSKVRREDPGGNIAGSSMKGIERQGRCCTRGLDQVLAAPKTPQEVQSFEARRNQTRESDRVCKTAFKGDIRHDQMHRRQGSRGWTLRTCGRMCSAAAGTTRWGWVLGLAGVGLRLGLVGSTGGGEWTGWWGVCA